MYSGQSVNQIEFIENGNYYSVASKIYFVAQTGIESSLDASSELLSMVFKNKDNSLYFGTHSSGLGRQKVGKINYYLVENSNLPRDLIRNADCDKSRNLWFDKSFVFMNMNPLLIS